MINIYYVVTNAETSNDIVYDIPSVPFWGLIILNTPALVEIQGTLQACGKDTALLFEPGHRCLVHSIDHHYSDDWIRFECNETYLNNSFIPFGVPISLNHRYQILDLFRIIAFENMYGGQSRDFCLSQLMQVLFHKLHDSAYECVVSPVHADLIRLHDEIYLHPEEDWNIAMMSSLINMSPRFLHSAYKEEFNVSCINDVINSRIQHAKRLLQYTNFTVAEISSACGYNNVEHFSRQFRQQTGISPCEYRRQCT